MGIGQIMAVPGHDQPNGQAEPKIRELKKALRTVINRSQVITTASAKVHISSQSLLRLCGG